MRVAVAATLAALAHASPPDDGPASPPLAGLAAGWPTMRQSAALADDWDLLEQDDATGDSEVRARFSGPSFASRGVADALSMVAAAPGGRLDRGQWADRDQTIFPADAREASLEE